MIDIASAAVFARNLVSEEVNSARPGAPPVPHVQRPPRFRRIRLGLSAALHRVAAAVEPAVDSARAPAVDSAVASVRAPAMAPAGVHPAC